MALGSAPALMMVPVLFLRASLAALLVNGRSPSVYVVVSISVFFGLTFAMNYWYFESFILIIDSSILRVSEKLRA